MYNGNNTSLNPGGGAVLMLEPLINVQLVQFYESAGRCTFV